MPRDQKTILLEMRELINELESATDNKAGGNLSTHKKQIQKKSPSPVIPKGAIGAINTLIEEKFLDTPKTLDSIIQKLKEIGHYHKRQTVSMNLLNLTKRRKLSRFKNKKKWEYVIRR